MVVSQNIREKFTLRGWVIWIICALFFLYEFFLRTFLGALANQIIPAIDLSQSQFAFLASSFYIAYGLMQIPVGFIADRYGIKFSCLIATFICALAAFLFSRVSTFHQALLFRFLMGLGGAFAFILLLITTVTWFPKKYLALLVGLGQFIGTMGALLAGGPLADLVSVKHMSWRQVFQFIAYGGAALFVLSIFFVKEGIERAHDYLIFLKKKEGIKKKIAHLVNSPQSLWVGLYSAFVFLSVAMLGAVWGTIYLQSLGFSQSRSALIVSMAWLGFACGCPLLGHLSDRMYLRRPLMIFCAALGLLLVSFLVYLPFKTYWPHGILFFLLGVTSSGQSIGFATITEHVNEHVKSIALGFNSALITLLAAISPLIVGFLLEHLVGKNISLSSYKPDDFMIPFTIMPLLYLLALIIVLFFIEETYCRSKREIIKIDKENLK